MTKEDFQQELWDTNKKYPIITDKHDPYKVGQLIFDRRRSVISYDITDNLYKFISTGITEIVEYTNIRHPKSPGYYEVVPMEEFSIASSGVISYGTVVSYTLDRIVAVYGQDRRLHIFGEDSKKIISRTTQRQLQNKYQLNSNKKYWTRRGFHSSISL